MNNNPSDARRFWLFMLVADGQSSVVVYDRFGRKSPSKDHVVLYNQVHKEFLFYDRTIVRARLRALDRQEKVLIPSVMEEYYSALSRYFREPDEEYKCILEGRPLDMLADGLDDDAEVSDPFDDLPFVPNAMEKDARQA